MPINIDTFKQRVEYLGAKDLGGGALKPNEFNNAIPAGVNDLLKKYLGPPEEYSPGMPIGQVGYEVSETITDFFDEIKILDKQIIVGKDGLAIKPVDYLRVSSIHIKYFYNPDNGKKGVTKSECCDTYPRSKKDLLSKIEERDMRVRILSDAKFHFYKNSHIRKATLEYPVCRFGGGKIEMMPKNVGLIYMTYLRKPAQPYWNYTIQNGIELYNPTGSTNIEIPELFLDTLAFHVCNHLGLHIRDSELFNAAELLKTKGV